MWRISSILYLSVGLVTSLLHGVTANSRTVGSYLCFDFYILMDSLAAMQSPRLPDLMENPKHAGKQVHTQSHTEGEHEERWKIQTYIIQSNTSSQKSCMACNVCLTCTS